MSKKATDYTPDPKNANKGSERGLYMLEQSVSETGLGRSIVVDKNGVVIAGNKTLQAAIDAGLVEVREVETDGKQLVVVRRTDLDLEEDERARKLAYFDNRTSQFMEWDSGQLLADLEAGFDLSGMFREHELEDLFRSITEPPTLDELEDQYGDLDEMYDWKQISLKVSPSTYDLYEQVLKDLPGDTEAQKFHQLLAMAL